MESPVHSDRSVSPMSRPAPKLQTDGLNDGNHAPSPLRQAQVVNGSIDHTNIKPPPVSIQSPNGTTRGDEFPFNAQPGAFGESPTNELLAQVQTADFSGPPSASRTKSTDGEAADVATDLVSPPNGGLSRRQTNEVEVVTPTGRRSVQFARSGTDSIIPVSHSREASKDQDNVDSPSRENLGSGHRFMSKLKSLATPSLHTRSESAWTLSSTPGEKHAHGQSSSAAATPGSERGEPSYGMGDSEADADADAESGGEIDELPGSAMQMPPRSRRKSRRPDDESQTAPTTPATPRNNFAMRHFQSARDDSTITPQSSTSFRPNFLRSATTNEMPEHRAGLSEDEGRQRLRLRDMAGARGLTYSGRRHRVEDQDGQPSSRSRPGNLRRITGFGNRETNSTRSPMTRPKGERQSTFGVQKWQQLKAGLKTFMQREKLRVDHAKSAELMAELLAGAPAALVAASMFQRDEHGKKRIPVLLEQLKLRITENKKVSDRSNIFTIELEYGNGLTRMKWIVHRSSNDCGKLWLSYRSKQAAEKFKIRRSRRHKLPRFPSQVFPYLRNIRGLLDDDDDDEDTPGPATDGEASASESRPHLQTQTTERRKQSFLSRHASSMQTPGVRGRLGSSAGLSKEEQEKNYTEMQRKEVESWLRKMVTAFYFRPDSNRFCKFLELSALGVRLGAEGSYHGKEGTLMIKTTKGIDIRRGWNPHLIKERHSPKWFLVRHSYVACVDSPEEMNIYDVILLDGDFDIQKKAEKRKEEDVKELAVRAKQRTTNPRYHHQLRIVNSERKLKLLGSHREIINQFEKSITFMKQNSPWGLPDKRFGSFAPVRKNVYAQWLVDGRDYMWQVSKAISRAKDVIYIHDWWLSPEVYMRRPPAVSQKWRLDRLLQRKAREGVKIFVIMYKNIDAAIPIDSEYSKFSLLDLHSNIFVQRSPNQMRQGTFFWSHHEKICVVDHNIAFCGGVDLCFGRWDTPSHTLVDDKLTGFELNDEPRDEDHVQMWPGKDYSNPRVQDFYDLMKPYEEMYDRSQVPRMPWHDIGMQIVGQPARDLTRHFVQRWNYILRQRIPTRPTPFLLPPPDFSEDDLEALDMHGTCEIQICRSSCDWSLGISKPEHSIMNAYVKLIEESDHLVYMENQFFITSCTLEGTKIENLIGDALVARIIRAHENDEDWRAIIVIPLMPGYQNAVDEQGGSSVRLIMSLQFRSISRGETSIFERLKAAGIEPTDYIQFFALRQWGKIGPNKTLVTEQLYIHAKVMVVDDRSAIIGSANINERSLLGTRDSEIAAIIRDTDMIESSMAGVPYQVGRFPHTLRMRLMQEHLGIDVDRLAEEERAVGDEAQPTPEPTTPKMHPTSPNAADRATELQMIESHHRIQDDMIKRAEKLHSVNHDLEDQRRRDHQHVTSDARVTHNVLHEQDVEGAGTDNMLKLDAVQAESRDSIVENGHEHLTHGHAHHKHPNWATDGSTSLPLPPTQVPRMDTVGLGLPLLSTLPALPTLDDTDIGAPPLERGFSSITADFIIPLLKEMRRPVVSDDCMKDPLDDSFYSHVWHQVAENNTRIFRHVFRCQPDNEVKTWEDYKQYDAFRNKFSEMQGAGSNKMGEQQHASRGATGPPGHGAIGPLDKVGALLGKVIPGGAQEKDHRLSEHKDARPSGDAQEVKAEQEKHRVDGRKTPEVPQAELNEKTGQEVGKVSPAKKDTPEMNEKVGLEGAPADGRVSAASGSVNEKAAIDNSDIRSNATTSPDFSTQRSRTITISEPPTLTNSSTNNLSRDSARGSRSRRGRRRGTTKSSPRQFVASDDVMLNKHDAEELLGMVQGTLVMFPYDWLIKEERNWLYTVDMISPLEIYA